MLRLKTLLQSKYLIVVILLFSICLALFRNYSFKINDPIINEFTGTLISKKIDGNKFTFVLENKYKVKGTYYIDTLEEKDYLENLKLGLKISINGSITDPINNTIPNTFNYREYIKHKRIKYTFKIDSFDVVGNVSIFYSLKNLLIDYMNTFKSRNYLNTFIIGNKDYLSEEIISTYQDLGVSHIFAISGMHISLLTGILMFVLKKFKREKNIIIIVFLLFYMFLTNYSASVLRSCILFIMLLLNKKFALNLSTLQVLYLAIALILFISPEMLYDIGFQYSVIVSYSLIKYNHLIKGNYFSKCLKISIIATLFSLPITLMNNYEVNILSVINNLFFVPLISFVIYPLSLLTLIIKPLDGVLYAITTILENIAPFFLKLNIIIPKTNMVVIVIYYLLLVIFFKTYNKFYLIAIFMLLLLIKIIPIIDNNCYVYFLDVKQGDSIVIKHRWECIMIDTGGIVGFNQDEWKKQKEYYLTDNTIKFLKSIGISHIDTLILTHGDYDHMGEALNLVNNFKVDKVIFNCGEYNDLEKRLIKVLDKKKIEHYSCIKELNIDNNKLQFLNTKEYDNENDNSNVIYLEYSKFKFLFMGDAGIEKEKDILDKYNLLNIDVLKVGHHGSKTSSSKNFINEINPKYGIISVGKNNKYGHPNNEVLDNLNDSIIYRTDIDGSVIFKIKKNKLQIQTCPP